MGLLFVAKGAERNHKKHIRHKEVIILVPFCASCGSFPMSNILALS